MFILPNIDEMMKGCLSVAVKLCTALIADTSTKVCMQPASSAQQPFISILRKAAFPSFYERWLFPPLHSCCCVPTSPPRPALSLPLLSDCRAWLVVAAVGEGSQKPPRPSKPPTTSRRPQSRLARHTDSTRDTRGRRIDATAAPQLQRPRAHRL